MTRALPKMLAFLMLLTPLSAAPFEDKTLVVVVVVDQMRHDQLELYRDLYLPAERGGFLRLAEGGVDHTRAFHDHFPTHTAVGHSSLSTGALPSVHGIVGNKILADDGIIEAGVDPASPIVGAQGTTAPGFSPRQLVAPTLGDTLKRATGGRAKVATVALKDRTAVLMAGSSADAALWLDEDTGNWVTSRFYAAELPEFVQRSNSSHHPRADFGRVWTPELSPTPLPSNISGEAALQGVSGDYKGLGAKFPHPIHGGHPEGPTEAFYAAWAHTPWALVSTVNLALQAQEEYKLGLDSNPDLLFVGFASLDKVGHAFGPDAPEALETLLQVDRSVAALLDGLDKRVGLKNCLVVLTSDHGVTPLPEHSTSLRMSARRLPLKEFRKRLEDRLVQQWERTDFRLELADPHLFLVPAAGKEAEKPAMLAALKDELEQTEGVLAALETTAVAEGRYGAAPYQNSVARSLFPGRSGDLLLVFEPNTILGYSRPGGTNHGSTWTDDTHVPLLAYGWGKRGREARTVGCRTS